MCVSALCYGVQCINVCVQCINVCMQCINVCECFMLCTACKSDVPITLVGRLLVVSMSCVVNRVNRVYVMCGNS